MKVVVLGATGFVGRHLCRSLLDRGHDVVAVSRDIELAKEMNWYSEVRYVDVNLYSQDWNPRTVAGDADVIVDLVWPGLPNYSDLFHFEHNLPCSYRMLKSFITAGYRRILVAGTCLEYGMQCGGIPVSIDAKPHISYAFAKNSLRQALSFLKNEYEFSLQWARLFYVVGGGQNPRSLLPMLEAAAQAGETSFAMSGGEQLRDFISIKEAARQLSMLAESNDLEGIFNVCTGKPQSVRRFVEDRIRELGVDIELELGRYPYPEHEPLAFWGQPHLRLLEPE